MSGQGDLLDLAEAIAARDEAVTRVGANADTAWMDAAIGAIWALAMIQQEITADDVWSAIGHTASTHEPRALGAAMKRAAGLGYITATDTYRPSTRLSCHARPVRVWRSEIAA